MNAVGFLENLAANTHYNACKKIVTEHSDVFISAINEKNLTMVKNSFSKTEKKYFVDNNKVIFESYFADTSKVVQVNIIS